MGGLGSVRRVLPLLAIVVGQVLIPFAARSPVAEAYSSISQKKGFDTCAAPSKSTMQTWWNQSPYWNIGIYIGGSNRSCAQPNLTSSWITAVQNQGWGLLPIWVGPQMPYGTCQTRHQYNTYISLNTSTAHDQGYNAASNAYSAALNLGFDVDNMPIIYDLEGYDGGSSCRAAAKAFMNGWVEYLHLPPAQKAGVYGSACSTFLDDFWGISNRPNFIWFAWWNGNPSTKNITCVDTGHWDSHQRHKQYRGGHNETYGGITINIDNDCSDGRVYYPYDRYDSSSPCI